MIVAVSCTTGPRLEYPDMKHRRFLKGIAFCLLALLAGLFAFLYITSRGQHRKYEIDYTIPAIGSWPSVGDLQVGIGVRQIIPLMNATTLGQTSTAMVPTTQISILTWMPTAMILLT